MAVNWTREQKQVIESRGHNLLVSAAAGSGKTAVLVERIIRMITDPENPTDIDRLLVMTFTRAAASEMRERIQEAIEKELERDPENAHLQQQAILVQFAQITTIDSFCLHILREHFDSLEIDPAFRVGDEGEMLLMRGDVMEELLEDFYRDGGEAYERFVDAYAVGKADGGIADYVMQVYTFAQSNPWPGEWFAQCREELLQTDPGKMEETRWMQFLLRDSAMQAQEWKDQLQEAVKLCQEEDGPAPYLPMVEEDLLHVERLCGATGNFESFCEALEMIRFTRLAAIRGKQSTVAPEKKEAVSGIRTRVKKAVEKLKEEYLFETPEQMRGDLEAGRDGVLQLLELAEEFGRRFREKKKEKNVVDFHDLEHFALEILTKEVQEPEEEKGRRVPGPLADEMSRQFDEILVDEYQDSNLVQETLISCISGERFGRPNVFMVGDVKQSIYKFRLARPELFLEKYHSYGKEDGTGRKIELYQNFRSRAHVLESINDVFYQIMTEKLGDIQYTDEQALHPGAVFEPREGIRELDTELLLVDTSPKEAQAVDEDAADYTARELEARMIASKIREMTDPETGILVWDKETARYRRAEFRDIVILLRSVSGWAEEFTEVLGSQGIPAFAESRTGYFNTMEVETILNFLAVLDNPMQDIPLASVLKSPFGNVTDSELAHLQAVYRACAEQTEKEGLYGAVQAFLKTMQTEAGTGADRILEEKLSGIMGKIAGLREEALYLTMHELLYRIYDETGYYRYVTALPGGETRRANLDMLVEKAAAYESTSYRGVFHFIRYIEKLKKYNTDFGEASISEAGGNCVRIMSIHKSKGLEFPVVFVSGMGKNFNKQDMRGRLLIDGDLGIGTDYLDSERRVKGPTLKKNVMKRFMELSALGEELRVLYVAMTRAKEKLILTAASGKLADRMAKWASIPLEDGRIPYTVLTMATSCLDWILMSVETGNTRIRVKEETALLQLDREVKSQFDREMTRRKLALLAEDGGDGTLSDVWKASYEFQYPFADDVILNTKISVSELKKRWEEKEEEEMEFLPTLPIFLEKQDREGRGATRGTAYHRVLELLPFETVETEEEAEKYLRSLVEDGKIEEEAAGLVRAADLSSFLDSSLGRRMKAAARSGRLWREKQFVIGVPAREMGDWDSDERILIQGVIDAFFEEDNQLILVDYKTDYVDNPDILRRRYEAQLVCYKRALEQMTGKMVRENYIYSFRYGMLEV